MKVLEMKDSITILECKCGYQWEEKLKLPMRMEAFVSRLKGWMSCPVCNGKKILLLTGEKYQEAKTKLEQQS